MKLDPNDIALIEKYLDGDLSPEETSIFEEKQENSAAFREAVVFHRQLLGHLEAQRKLILKAELQGMMTENVKEERGFEWNWKVFSVAASVLLVLGFVGVLKLQGPTPSQELFQQYFDPYPVMSVVRGDTPNGLDPLHVYAEGKYGQFVEIMADERNAIKSSKLQLAYGNALLAIAQPERAIEELETIRQGEDYYLDAQWYLALAHLRLQNFSETRALLEQLVEQQTFYKSSAKKLIASLEETDN